MTKTPIVPSAVIPPGAPLPPRPPEPGELPPWRAAPPPPPPPPTEPAWHSVAPAPSEMVHRVRVEVVFPEPEPEPSRWQRLAGWLAQFGKPWQAAAALTLAVTPIPGTGYSVATTWAYTVSLGRDLGPWQPYALGGIPFALVVTRILRHGGTVYRLFGLTISAFGVWGAVDWFDIVTIITGVTR
jgi:hypothetical protein